MRLHRLDRPRTIPPAALFSEIGMIPPGATALLAWRARDPGATSQALDAAIRDGKLVEVRSLRAGTMVVPRPLTAAAVRGASKSVIAKLRGPLAALGVDEDDLTHMKQVALQALNEGEASYADLRETLPRGSVKEFAIEARPKVNGLHSNLSAALASLEEEAAVVRSRGSGDAVFKLWKHELPDVNADLVPPEIARRELARHYLRAAGPATVNDFANWLGITPREASLAIEALGDEVAQIQVEKISETCFLLAESLSGLKSARPTGGIALLPYRDPLFALGPALLSALTPPALHKVVFADVGSAPLIVADGQPLGRWHWEPEHGVVMDPFKGSLPPKFRAPAEALAAQLTQFVRGQVGDPGRHYWPDKTAKPGRSEKPKVEAKPKKTTAKREARRPAKATARKAKKK